ncbi:MAG: recombination protein RecR [Propionibacterium sp.]|nr:MAG: recombination protein RecR [Propionibacterium sp.]
MAELGKLPTIGPRTAARLAFHILDADEADVMRLAQLLAEVKQSVHPCQVCYGITEAEVCRVCADPRRDPRYICVVEESKDLMSIEKTGEFSGTYHVLGGSLSPMDGRGPDKLRITELIDRVTSQETVEVILATDPNNEGDATANFIARKLEATGVTVSRLASGLPVGGDLEYADDATLGRAFAGRVLARH